MSSKFREGRNGGKLKIGGRHPNSGRPKKYPKIDEVLNSVLGNETGDGTPMEKVFQALQKKAVKGDVRAAELLLKYAYGLPKQEAKLTHEFTTFEDGGVMTDNEFKAIAALIRTEDDPSEG